MAVAQACMACGTALTSTDAACPRCGWSRPLPPRSAARWYHNVWFVLLMISPVALGPFGLPLLWKTPRLGRGAKTIWTLITLGWTAWLVVYIMTVVWPAMQTSINDFNSTLAF
jgi:hypothetical protein